MKSGFESTTSAQPNANLLAGRPRFDVFSAESEDIENFLERLQEYFTAYNIKNDMGDEFLESIFTLEESQKLELRKSGLSAPTVEVPVQIEGVEFRTMAAMRIYARYLPVIFLTFFKEASILVEFLVLEETTFKSSPEQFLSLEVKAVCIAAGVSMERSMDIFLFLFLLKLM